MKNTTIMSINYFLSIGNKVGAVKIIWFIVITLFLFHCIPIVQAGNYSDSAFAVHQLQNLVPAMTDAEIDAFNTHLDEELKRENERQWRLHMKTVGIFLIATGTLFLGVTYSEEIWSFAKSIGRAFIESNNSMLSTMVRDAAMRRIETLGENPDNIPAIARAARTVFAARGVELPAV